MKTILISSLLLMSFSAYSDGGHNSSRSNKSLSAANSLTDDLTRGPNNDFAETISIDGKADLIKMRIIMGTFINTLVKNAVDNDCTGKSDDDSIKRCGHELISQSERETLALHARSGKVKFFNESKGFGFVSDDRYVRKRPGRLRSGDPITRKRPGRIRYADITLERDIVNPVLEQLNDFTNLLEDSGDTAEAYTSGDLLSEAQQLSDNTEFLKAHSIITAFANNLLENLRSAQKKDFDTIDNAPEEKERGIIINTSLAGFEQAVIDAERDTEAAYSTGTVKFFNESKGFGFRSDGEPSKVVRIKGHVKYFNSETQNAVVIDNESGKEYFVHLSGLIDEIREDDTVIFEVSEGKKGLNAVNVKVI